MKQHGGGWCCCGYHSPRRTMLSWVLASSLFLTGVAVAVETECFADGRCSTTPNNNPIEIESNPSNVRYLTERIDTEDEDHCGLYMAESSIDGAGWGMFAGRDTPQGSTLLNDTMMDVILQFVDGREQADYQKLFGVTLPRLLFRSYFWKATDTYADFDADDVDSIVPGLGMLANCHLGLVNMEQRGCRRRGASGRAFPTAGASSSYHDCDFVATRPIPAGHELYVDYGDAWFERRPDVFGSNVPLTADYQLANRIVQLWQAFVRRTFQVDTASAIRASDLWGTLVRSVGPHLTPRQRRALPRSALDAARIPFDDATHVHSVAYHEIPHAVRSRDWLRQHGVCLDHIAVQPLLGNDAAGRERSHERTAAARRWIAAGDVVAPAPLIHLSRQHAELLYVDAQGEPRDTILWKGHQLLLNYCFGHASSSLLLFPYSPGVNLINHPDLSRNQTPNVALRWSPRMRHPEWLDYNVSTILHQTQHAGLLMEFYALRDIPAGDEILLDYGPAWTNAWDTHVRHWNRRQRQCTTATPVVHADTHTAAWDYRHACDQNVTDQHRYDCLYDPPSWINVRCWVEMPAKLAYDSEDDWWLWQPPADYDERNRTLDDTLTCQVLRIDQDGTYRVRVQRNHWLTVQNGVNVKRVPRSAFDLVDQPYTSDQFLRSAFRHEIQLPDDMVPRTWRDLESPPTDDTCGLYMAESSIPNSGLGIYSANNISRDDAIFYEDLVVHVEDFEMNAKLRHWANNESAWLLDSYYWNPKTTMGNFDADDIQSIIPGFGMLSNSHAAILNADVKAPKRFADLHRGEDPGVGASTMYHGSHFTAARDIEAGSELFVQYGNNWFIDRTESLGMIPLSSDFFYADFIVHKISRILEQRTERGAGTDSDKWMVDLLSLVANMCAPRPRLVNAIPRSVDSFHRAANIGTAALSIPNRVRSLEWLETNGRCLDQIRPGPSSIQQAGRGAFATRHIRRGDRITTMPLVHLRRHDLELYGGDNFRDPKASIWREGSQLILNYCYGHAESSLLLFPYSPVVNYVNSGDSGKVNAALQWSTMSYHKQEWLERSPDDIGTEEHSGLIMELMAQRDIAPGEEIFLSYGPAWDDAWQNHVRNWSARDDDLMYTSPATMNERLEWIRTEAELVDYPYPVANHDEIVTVCFVGSLKNPMETQNSRGEVIQTVQWIGRDNLFDTSDYAYPCGILERHSSEDADHAHDRQDSIKPVDLTFTVVVQTKEGGPTQVNGVPRKAIQFFDAPYKSNDALRTAFRHEIHLPDDMVPEAWKDLTVEATMDSD